AKGAVFGFTRTLAAEGAAHGIGVNAVAPRAATRMSDGKTLSRVFGLPEASLAGVMTALPPDLVSPAAVFLAHEFCRLNGEVLVAGGGQVQRLAVLASAGIHRESLTPEDIAADLGTVLDLTGATVVGVNDALDAAS